MCPFIYPKTTSSKFQGCLSEILTLRFGCWLLLTWSEIFSLWLSKEESAALIRTATPHQARNSSRRGIPSYLVPGPSLPPLELVVISIMWFRNSQRPHHIPPEWALKIPPGNLLLWLKHFLYEWFLLLDLTFIKTGSMAPSFFVSPPACHRAWNSRLAITLHVCVYTYS